MIVARTVLASMAGRLATGMSKRWATLDRLIPAALWLMPRKMTTWPPSSADVVLALRVPPARVRAADDQHDQDDQSRLDQRQTAPARRRYSCPRSSSPEDRRGAGSSCAIATATCGAVRVSRWARPAGLSVRNGVPPLPLEAAPTITEASLGGSSAVALSTTSATMQVMLSGPPPRMASSTSCSTTSFRLADLASVRVQGFLADHPGQPVRAEQVPVARAGPRAGSGPARRRPGRPGRAAASSAAGGWPRRPG